METVHRVLCFVLCKNEFVATVDEHKDQSHIQNNKEHIYYTPSEVWNNSLKI
jgi:hypothetical protein